MSRAEAENVAVLASAREDAEDHIRKIILHEGELVVKLQAQEVSKREHREQFEELTLLQIRGFELCHVVVCPPRLRHHLSEGMWLAALHHTEMPESLPHFGWRCPLPRSQCLVAHPTAPFAWG
jgi:hypothetical protein